VKILGKKVRQLEHLASVGGATSKTLSMPDSAGLIQATATAMLLDA